jgi:uncharacterized protein
MYLNRRLSKVRPFLLIIVILGLVAGAFGDRSARAQPHQPQSLETSFLYIETEGGRVQFTVELADSPEERAIGLMYRDSMPMNHGMIFKNPRLQQTSFWMKNTFFSLDLIFIRRDGTIANIVRNTIPRTLAQIRSRGRVMAVLELNAGVSERLGIAEGDMIRHAIFGNIDDGG